MVDINKFKLLGDMALDAVRSNSVGVNIPLALVFIVLFAVAIICAEKAYPGTKQNLLDFLDISGHEKALEEQRKNEDN